MSLPTGGGVGKELTTVLLAVFAGEHFSALNGFGLVLCVAGDVVYFMQRTREKQEAEEQQPVIEEGRVASHVAA